MPLYDVVVIGTGTAGQTAAYELKQRGLEVAVAEKSDTPGGICALAGCQAKKWFYEGAELMAKANHLTGKGVTVPPKAEWADFLNKKNEFTSAVPANTLSGLKKASIDVLEGQARFIDPKTILVAGRKISAKNFVIAAGARPVPLPINGIDHAITSDQFLELGSLPDRFVFIGGGFISFEFAHFVARLGVGQHRKITILEAAPRPLGPFDSEMVSLLVTATKEEGVDVHTDVQIAAIEKEDDVFRVMTDGDQAYTADIVVNGAGRVAAIDDLELDKAGVETSRKGISVNASMQTTQPHIFAIGDCAETLQLARVADYEALVAADTIVNKNPAEAFSKMAPAAVPALLFTYPQYGMLGHTEDALKKKGTAYSKSFGKNLSWPTYRRIGMSHAAYKILVDTDGQFLGAHVLSDNAAGVINTLRLAMINRIPAQTLYRQSILSPYPTRESDLLYMLKPLT